MPGLGQADAVDDRHRRRSARRVPRRRRRHRVVEHLSVAAAHRSRDARVRDERRRLRVERRPRRTGDPAAVDRQDGAADAGVSRPGVLGHRRHLDLRARAQLLPARLRHGAGVHRGDARSRHRPQRDQGADRRHDASSSSGTPTRAGRRSRTSAACRRDRVVTHSQIKRPGHEGVPRRPRSRGLRRSRARVRPREHGARGRTSSSSPRTCRRSPLWNPDLAPTRLEQRTWSTYHIAALWIGMSVVITTYTLASGLMQQGMTWWQAMITILLGNVIVLVPMVLNAHAGTKYGVSFPVLCRASLRRPRRQRAGDAARDRRLRLVRHPDVDRRPGAAHADDRGVERLDRRCPATSGSRSRSSGWSRCAIILRGLEGIKMLEAWSAPLLLAGGVALLIWAIRARRRPRPHPRRVEPAAAGQHAVLAAVPGGAHRQRRLLGDAQPQHPRLHPLRAQPALAGARAGARPADDDDAVRVHRRGGDERHDRRLRRGDLGSGRADRAHRQPARDHRRRAGRARRAADDQHGGQRRVAGQRLLEPGAAAHQLRDGRADHRGDRHADDAVEALCRRRRLHLHLADRLFEPDGRDRRHPHRRLLGGTRPASSRCATCSIRPAATPIPTASTARPSSRWFWRSCRSCPGSCGRRRRRAGRSPSRPSSTRSTPTPGSSPSRSASCCTCC